MRAEEARSRLRNTRLPQAEWWQPDYHSDEYKYHWEGYPLTVYFSSPEHVLRLGAFRFEEGYLFRGQADVEWHLETTLIRHLRQAPDFVASQSHSSNPEEIMDRELQTIRRFQSMCSTNAAGLPNLDDYLGWLFLMRHHGAPVRLLDWTRSFFVALFHACEDVFAKGGPTDGAIWWISEHEITRSYWDEPLKCHPMALRTATSEKAGYVQSQPKFWDAQNRLARACLQKQSVLPVLIRPGSYDSRMVAQQAAFTFHSDAGGPQPTDPGSTWPPPTIKMTLHGSRYEVTETSTTVRKNIGPRVYKARINAHWKFELMRALHRMNVTHATLYPGMDGIGRASGMFLGLGMRMDVDARPIPKMPSE